VPEPLGVAAREAAAGLDAAERRAGGREQQRPVAQQLLHVGGGGRGAERGGQRLVLVLEHVQEHVVGGGVAAEGGGRGRARALHARPLRGGQVARALYYAHLREGKGVKVTTCL